MNKTSWGFSPELNRKIDSFFSNNTDSNLTFPISFFPTEGISTYTDNGTHYIETELPGVGKDSLVVTYNDYDGYLTISGSTNTRNKSSEVKKTVYIGENLDDKLMTASLKDGILKISIPQTETPKTEGKIIKVY